MKQIDRQKRFLCLLLLFGSAFVQAQLAVRVIPNHDEWNYRIGEKVIFDVIATFNGENLNDIAIDIEIGPEMTPPTQHIRHTLKDGKARVEGERMKTAGFQRCKATVSTGGQTVSAIATISFSPEAIRPTTSRPKDFDNFWKQAIAKQAELPADPQVTLLPDRCTEELNVYHVRLQHFKKDSHLYGILCIPKAPDKYPAILEVPGAGVRGYAGQQDYARRGVITLQIGIHGIPVTLDKEIYADLSAGALDGYQTFGIHNRDQYYYKRVILGCIRAVDFLCDLPEFDGNRLLVYGSSQGGALAMITAALDCRITGLVALCPALCDMTGKLKGRAGGWPHYLDKEENRTPQIIETSKYFDVVNFAPQISVPGFYSWGYNDAVCPPTSTYAAYNAVTAPKTLFIVKEIGHTIDLRQYNEFTKWIFEKL